MSELYSAVDYITMIVRFNCEISRYRTLKAILKPEVENESLYCFSFILKVNPQNLASGHILARELLIPYLRNEGKSGIYFICKVNA